MMDLETLALSLCHLSLSKENKHTEPVRSRLKSIRAAVRRRLSCESCHYPCAFKSAFDCSGAKNTTIFRRQTGLRPSPFPGDGHTSGTHPPEEPPLQFRVGACRAGLNPSCCLPPRKNVKLEKRPGYLRVLPTRPPPRKNAPLSPGQRSPFSVRSQPRRLSRGPAPRRLASDEAVSAEGGFTPRQGSQGEPCARQPGWDAKEGCGQAHPGPTGPGNLKEAVLARAALSRTSFCNDIF